MPIGVRKTAEWKFLKLVTLKKHTKTRYVSVGLVVHNIYLKKFHGHVYFIISTKHIYHFEMKLIYMRDLICFRNIAIDNIIVIIAIYCWCCLYK